MTVKKYLFICLFGILIPRNTMKFELSEDDCFIL